MGYGTHGQDATVLPSTAPESVVGGTPQRYVFDTAVGLAWVWVHPDATQTLFIRFNVGSASLTRSGSSANWDAIRQAAEMLSSPKGIRIGDIVIDCLDGETATFGTDFIIKGFVV